MNKLTLYLMLGFPGAGKTTVSKIIHELTGAVHLWADKIRRERFGTPNYSHKENVKLYEHLNEITAELLNTGQDVIFDTNFNFYKDRQKLRHIAANHAAQTRLIWVQTPKLIAQGRATKDAHQQANRVLGNMPVKHFERMSSNLEPPHKDEPYIRIDGTRVTRTYVRDKLALE